MKRLLPSFLGAFLLAGAAWAQEQSCPESSVEISRMVIPGVEEDQVELKCRLIAKLDLKALQALSQEAVERLSTDDREALERRRGELEQAATDAAAATAAALAAELPFMPDDELARFELQLEAESHPPAATAALLAVEAALLAVGGAMLLGFAKPFEAAFPGARKGLALGALLGFGLCAGLQSAAGIPFTVARTTVTVAPAPVGFAPGLARSALLVDKRVQHAAQKLIDAKLLPNWSSANAEAIRKSFEAILENPRVTFDHTLRGPVAARGFSGQLNGQDVVVFVFKESDKIGQIASAWVPSASQAARWGVK